MNKMIDFFFNTKFKFIQDLRTESKSGPQSELGAQTNLSAKFRFGKPLEVVPTLSFLFSLNPTFKCAIKFRCGCIHF